MPARDEPPRSCDGTEHRWGRRIPLEVPVKLGLGGRTVGRGLLRNASISGALIESAVELPVFTNLLVVLPTTSEAAPSSVELAACVIRRETGGFAVEWRDMACPSIVELIERISGVRLANLCDDPAYTTGRAPCASAS